MGMVGILKKVIKVKRVLTEMKGMLKRLANCLKTKQKLAAEPTYEA